MHDGTCLCAKVQGWIQETILLDAGERKMLLISSREEEKGDNVMFSRFQH